MNIFFPSPNKAGSGTMTFTVHLIYGMMLRKIPVDLYCLSNKTEDHERKFGYGINYRNLSLIDTVRKIQEGPSLITSSPPKKKLEALQLMLKSGAHIVIHDHKAFKNGLELSWLKHRPICIRKRVARSLGGKFLRHPYWRRLGNKRKSLDYHACCLTRITSNKNIEWLLDANRLLPKDKQIEIRGAVNRMYQYHVLKKKYPEWELKERGYPKELNWAPEFYERCKFAVDMTLQPGQDGGGTQYTFLEAMDGGAINVIQREWLHPNDEMVENENCLAVDDPEELAVKLKKRWSKDFLNDIRNTGYDLLEKHNAKKVAIKWLKYIQSS